MRTKARFVNAEDYFNLTGIDLNYQLRANENESNKVNCFLRDVEDTLLTRLDIMFCRKVIWDRWDRLTEEQRESIQMAILKQVEYTIRNGDLFTDSGYDVEKGEIISRDKISSIAVCQSSIDFALSRGVYSHVIQNHRRYLQI